MRLFVIPDIHGHFAALEGLLKNAGVIDAEGNRVEGITTVSVGDLCNAVDSSVNGDSECLLKVRDWIDQLIMGNHEMPWVYSGLCDFSGFYDAPHNGSLYRQLMREGIVVPAYCDEANNLLITHAGVHKAFEFDSAQDAFETIMDLWETPMSGWVKLGVQEQLPKRLLYSAISPYRGGLQNLGGIFWRDWHEPLQKNFNQIVGHTPISKPDLWCRKDGTFSVNIDCGAKHGRGATGMFFDNGEIEFVEWSPEPEQVLVP